MGILSLMYHRFNEDKYPSTNIQMDIFKNQLEIIKQLNLNFIPKNLTKNLFFQKRKKNFNYMMMHFIFL